MKQLEGIALRGLDQMDTQLVDELRRGSSAALGSLFDRHADAIYTYCFRRTASCHNAEDATSTVFLELWRGRENAQAYGGSALPWLYGIARNICRTGDRSARRLNLALHRLPRERGRAGIDDVAEGVVRRIDAERQMAEVLAPVAALPARERDVLELVAWAGLSYEATAAALHVPVGTVRSRLSRARRRLSAVVADPAP